MMKLISLNVEGSHHEERVMPFLCNENPDVICLQEAVPQYRTLLEAEGYHTIFQPRVRKLVGDQLELDGNLIAARTLFEVDTHYYYRPSPTIQVEDLEEKRETNTQGVMFASIPFDTTTYHVANTHFTWAPDGAVANDDQREDLPKLLAYLATKPAHILCGDMNIPRHHNELYESLIEHYTDNIPAEYNSSLDKDWHVAGKKPGLAHLFTDFMVDYVFTQAPYQASNTRLEFGLSDHAAVITTIQKQ